MSWEDCGFKPGKIFGDPKCPRTCSGCDGEHHFYVQCRDGCLDEDEPREQLPEGLNPDIHFKCKHCGTYAEAVDDDGGEGGEGGSADEDLDPANHCTCGGVRNNRPCDVWCAIWSPTEGHGPLFDDVGDDGRWKGRADE